MRALGRAAGQWVCVRGLKAPLCDVVPLVWPADATLGIVGMGQIGRNVAKRALGFDMRVLYHNRRPVDDEVEASLRAEYCSTLDELLAASDFVVLACPCTAETEGMIGSDQLGRMKRTAILVNVGRGKLVDQAALVEALRSRSIAGCATDGAWLVLTGASRWVGNLTLACGKPLPVPSRSHRSGTASARSPLTEVPQHHHHAPRWQRYACRSHTHDADGVCEPDRWPERRCATDTDQ